MTITQTMKTYLKYKGNNQWEPEIEHIGKSVQMEGEWYLLWVCLFLLFFLLFCLSGFSIIDYPFGFSNVYLMPLSTKFQIYRGFSSLLADETGAPGENHRPVI